MGAIMVLMMAAMIQQAAAIPDLAVEIVGAVEEANNLLPSVFLLVTAYVIHRR
jgi:hypothetical protein